MKNLLAMFFIISLNWGIAQEITSQIELDSLFDSYDIQNDSVSFQFNIGTISKSDEPSRVSLLLIINNYEPELKEILFRNIKNVNQFLLDNLLSGKYDWFSTLILSEMFQENLDNIKKYEFGGVSNWRKEQREEDYKFWKEYLDNYDWDDLYIVE